MGCCNAAGAFLIPGGLCRSSAARPSPPGPDFHLHPHYRDKTPLDAALLQIKPGLDSFVTEKYHDSIAVILDMWSTSLLQSPTNTQVFENALSGNFLGTSWQPAESHPLRPVSTTLDVRRFSFCPAALFEIGSLLSASFGMLLAASRKF